MNKVSRSEYRPQGGEAEAFRPWVILVCGVDIVNSTGHKMRNPSGWYDKFSNFFIEFERTLRNKDKNDGDKVLDGWNLWRVVGDELIYYRAFSVDAINDDYSHLNAISGNVYTYIHEFSESVKNVAKSTNLNLRGYSFLLDEDKAQPDSEKGDAELKGSVIGDFRFNFVSRDYGHPLFDSDDDPYVLERNYNDFVMHKFKGNLDDIKSRFFIDFIGRGVDQGFRLAEYSSANCFILSPKLVYCLCCASNDELEILENIYFLGSHGLKGCGNEEMGISGFPICFLMIEIGINEINSREHRYYESMLDKEAEKRIEKIRTIVDSFIIEERSAYRELLNRISKAQVEETTPGNDNSEASESSAELLDP